MNLNNSNHADDINLLDIIRRLCNTKIRHPMTIEQVKAWLKQFSPGAEKILALLILRYLIYRTTSQLDSSFKQALKAAAISFIPPDNVKENTNWRDVLNGAAGNFCFHYGPLRHKGTLPGKSGEMVSRRLKYCDPNGTFNLAYLDQLASLKPNEKYLLIDDGAFTGDQLNVFIKSNGQFLLPENQSGIVVGLAHEAAIELLGNTYPTIPIFYGEKITSHECFEAMSQNWIDDGIWPYPSVTPLNLYMEIIKKAKFSDRVPLGYGNLGCMVAYEHGVPDNSLQLLWGKSKKWNPLFVR